MKVILLNGPPRCGKDTAGEILARHGAYVTKFAKRLKEMVHRAFGVVEDTRCPAPHYAFETEKDEPQEEFYGATPRNAYIHFSEGCLKPLLGERIFGELVAEELGELELCTARPVNLVAVTDSGFKAEAEVLIEKHDCVLVRLHRDGCSFDGDSRGYLALPGVETHDIVNDGTIEDLERKLVEVLNLVTN